jgi:hypothetical protein
MEPEGSLPCSQEPSTGPYSESDQSKSHHPIVSIVDFTKQLSGFRSNLYFSHEIMITKFRVKKN